MLKLIPNNLLCSKWTHLSIIISLIFLLTYSLTTIGNTQIQYPPINLPGSFRILGFPYQPPSFSYTNYAFDPIRSSLTSSFILEGDYSIPFSQAGINNYSFQFLPNLTSETVSPSLFGSLTFSYKNPLNLFNYQTSFTQFPNSTNFNTSYLGSFMPTTKFMSYVFPSDKFSYSYYPGDIYDQKTPANLTNNLPQEPGEIIGTIGIITDIHYADKDSTDRRSQFSLSGPRFYGEAADDLADFVNKMNSLGVDAVIELGDFVDIHSGNSEEEGNTNTHDDGAHGEAILFEVESVYSKLVMPYYHVIGNWDMYDYDFATADEWFRHIINGTPETIVSLGGEPYTDAIGNPVSRYYAFKFGEVLGIVLDSSGSNALRDNYLMHTTGINGTGFVPWEQLEWLKEVLEDNKDGENMPVIVFIHPFLYPEFKGHNYYMCRNYLDVRDILEADDNVLAVFNGHHHPGADGWWEDTQDDPDSNVYHDATGVFGEKHNGIKYYNLRGSIIGWGSDSSDPIEEPSNAYYVLTVEKGESISLKVDTFRTN